MAYLSQFKYDIFISYARLNNKIPPGKTEGWVTRFHRELDYALSQRFEREGEIKIWFDTEEVDENTFYDDAIPESVNESAVFLALTTEGYLSSRSYCPKELSWFHKKASREPYKLKVNNRSRIFNLLLQNVPREKWLPELKGTTGFPFNDARGSVKEGQPSQPGTPLFEHQMRRLVDALVRMLRALKARTVVTPRVAPPPTKFTIFLAHTEGTLETRTRHRVLAELWQHDIEVITDIPPPDSPEQHDQKVAEGMRRAGLCVHLLDGAPGRKMPADGAGDAQETTYYRRQVELGLESGKPQLICVPKRLSVQGVKNIPHRRFLHRLENDKRGQASYTFIRKSHHTDIAREILQEIERLKVSRARGPRPTALLDIHEKDYEVDYDSSLHPVLRKRNLGLVINPSGDDGPQQDMTVFDGVRQLVKVLIIVLGHVAEKWASNRLNSALQGAHSSLKLCGIYVPERRVIDYGAFQIQRVKIPVAIFFTPENLNELLDKHLKD